MRTIIGSLILAAVLALPCYAQSTGLGFRDSGTAATSDQSYVTFGNTPDLSAERALTGSSTITVTDGGANGAITLSVNGPLIPSAGGTGIASYTAGDILVVNDAGTLVKFPIGTNGKVLSVNTALNPKFEWVAAGIGSVTSFSAGDLSPLFTTAEADPTTTPALTFSLSNAAAHTFFGNNTGSLGAPSYSAITTADLPAGTGTVTSFSAGDLSPLFTTSEATATTTPALTFSLSNAAAYTVFGNNTSGSAAPAFQSLVSEQLPSGTQGFGSYGGSTSWRALPTSGTLTGEYVNYGNWASTNAITCNRCRIINKGTWTLTHTITVGTSVGGGAASNTAAWAGGGNGAGLGGGRGGNFYNTTTVGGAGGGSASSVGGAGGSNNANTTNVGGQSYPYESSLCGSGGGGGGSGATAGAGGAGSDGFYLESSGDVTISGTINADGAAGTAGATNGSGGGGGSGGTVAILSSGNVNVTGGTLTARGGAGGNQAGTGGAGGGGAGGRVFIRCTGTYTAGTNTVTGGGAGTGGTQAAAAGSAGTSDTAGSASYPARFAP